MRLRSFAARRWRLFAALAAFVVCVIAPTVARAHVKWFSAFDLGQPPLPWAAILTPTFFAILALSVVVMGAAVVVDQRLAKHAAMERLDAWLARRQPQAHLVLRIATGAVLLMSWQAGTLLFPELPAGSATIGWVQFLLALLLLFERTTPIVGAALVAGYVWALARFGALHMLDYAIWPGAGVYLALHKNPRPQLAGLALPALYGGTGFGLCWVAMEKLVYPAWGLEVLASQPALTLGFEPGFFLVGAAFVEFCLGYLLIICLLERPNALLITIVFFCTTAVFGKTEVIGHTLVHGALIVFVLEGPGAFYRSPIRFHEKVPLRIAFAAVNLVLACALVLGSYHTAASRRAAAAPVQRGAAHSHRPVTAPSPAPTLALKVTPDAMGGYNVKLTTSHFVFAPSEAGQAHRAGVGHAHLYVDGTKRARLYGPWFHLDLPPGEHRLRVTLNANDHRTYHVDGRPIEARVGVSP